MANPKPGFGEAGAPVKDASHSMQMVFLLPGFAREVHRRDRHIHRPLVVVGQEEEPLGDRVGRAEMWGDHAGEQSN